MCFTYTQGAENLNPVIDELLQIDHTGWGQFLTCRLLPRYDAACQQIGQLSFAELTTLRQVRLVTTFVTSHDAGFSKQV